MENTILTEIETTVLLACVSATESNGGFWYSDEIHVPNLSAYQVGGVLTNLAKKGFILMYKNNGLNFLEMAENA